MKHMKTRTKRQIDSFYNEEFFFAIKFFCYRTTIYKGNKEKITGLENKLLQIGKYNNEDKDSFVL